MKTKLVVLFIVILITLKGYSQDSTRTINDKPGTPQSLRSGDNLPRNKVHVINENKAQNQSINHGSTESNKVVQKKPQTLITTPAVTNGKAIPKTPITILNNPQAKRDTVSNKNSISNKPENVTNPIRK